MFFQPCIEDDYNTIFHFYDLAVEYQKKVFNKSWQGFDSELVKMEIKEERQWKIIIDDQIVCVFAITFDDPNIWKEKSKGSELYFHRIVTHPDFKGKGMVKEIIKWGKQYAKTRGLTHLRMDTWGDNQVLIDYYQKCGFDFLGIINPATEGLPKHYNFINLSLFEIKI